MRQNELHELLDKVLETRGADEVSLALTGLLDRVGDDRDVLTIVANAGVHEIPKSYLRGEVYEASRGDWDASTQEALLIELRAILARLVSKLRSSAWERIYLIPTGHPILSVQIKALVYRALRMNTIDLYYKSGRYFEVNIDQRAIAIEAGNNA